MSEEHRQLTTQLTVWQQQIKRLVQSQAGLPKRAKAGRRNAENQAPPPAHDATVQSAAVACSHPQSSGGGGDNPAPLRSVQGGNQVPSQMQQRGNAAGRKDSSTPSADGLSIQQRSAILSSKAAMCEADMRRKRMRERVRAAELRISKAKEQVQVPVCGVRTAC